MVQLKAPGTVLALQCIHKDLDPSLVGIFVATRYESRCGAPSIAFRILSCPIVGETLPALEENREGRSFSTNGDLECAIDEKAECRKDQGVGFPSNSR